MLTCLYIVCKMSFANSDTEFIVRWNIEASGPATVRPVVFKII